jgi:uncharacterized protein (UPF0332 family)
MKQTLDEDSTNALVRYRLNRAKETIAEAKVISANGFYNTALNRLYYACYYAVIALLVKNQLPTQTHAGVKQMLGLHFISTNRLHKEYGRFYSQLFNDRISSDYDDFITFDKESIEELTPKAEEFVTVIEALVVNE